MENSTHHGSSGPNKAAPVVHELSASCIDWSSKSFLGSGLSCRETHSSIVGSCLSKLPLLIKTKVKIVRVRKASSKQKFSIQFKLIRTEQEMTK
jgi:hypothetical protein